MRGLLARRVFSCACLVCAGATAGRAQSAGLPPEWEVRDSLTALAKQTERLRPLIKAARPDEWSQKGAPDAYKAQWKSVIEEIDYVGRSAGQLSADPERLSLALETYFRTKSLGELIESLNEGVRKYQNPALADLIDPELNAVAAGGQKLKEYIVELAAVKENQFKVMDAEAQRCRVSLSGQTPARSGPARKTESK
jgi:hypothetical protein